MNNDAAQVILIRTWLERDLTLAQPHDYQYRRSQALARLRRAFPGAEIEVATRPWPAAGEPTAITADEARHFDGPLVDRILALVREEGPGR